MGDGGGSIPLPSPARRRCGGGTARAALVGHARSVVVRPLQLCSPMRRSASPSPPPVGAVGSCVSPPIPLSIRSLLHAGGGRGGGAVADAVEADGATKRPS